MAEEEIEEPEVDADELESLEDELDVEDDIVDVFEDDVDAVDVEDEVIAVVEDGEVEPDEETDEALDELEAEEFELLDDELAETLLVDEAAELRAIRREELTMNVEAQVARPGEFVCQSCFLVKRTNQIANKRKMYCLDCAS